MANVTLAGTPTGGETVTVAVNETTAEYTLTKADTTQSAVNILSAMLNESFGSLYVAPYIASAPAGSPVDRLDFAFMAACRDGCRHRWRCCRDGFLA